MKITTKEKNQIIAFIVIWAIIGTAGFAFFWLQSPDRRIDRIISKSDIALLRTSLRDVTGQQVTELFNADVVGEAPQKIGNTPVSQGVKDNWAVTLNDTTKYLKEQVNYDSGEQYSSKLKSPLSLDLENSYTSAEYSMTAQGDVVIQSCPNWTGIVEESWLEEGSDSPEISTSRSGWSACLDVFVSKESKEITRISLSY